MRTADIRLRNVGFCSATCLRAIAGRHKISNMSQVRLSAHAKPWRATLGLQADDYEIDARLIEIAYGEWEGLTLREIETQNASVLSARERDKWDFAPLGGESYRELADRIGSWYKSLAADTVVAAHGGGVRALMAILNIVSEEQATHAQIAQGIIYVFADGKMSRYA